MTEAMPEPFVVAVRVLPCCSMNVITRSGTGSPVAVSKKLPLAVKASITLVEIYMPVTKALRLSTGKGIVVVVEA